MLNLGWKQKKQNKKHAFTLSEVLICLTILGVLGAILIPVIISQKPDANKVMFKKEYNVLSKAISKMINDDTIYPANQTFIGTDSQTYSSGFNYKTDNAGRAGTKHKFCYYLADNLNLLGPDTCPEATETSASGTTAEKFATTTDGADWFLSRPPVLNLEFQTGDYPTSINYQTHIVIDVNGENNGPNCSSDMNADIGNIPTGYTGGNTTICPKPDTFIVGILFNGSIKAGSSANAGGSTDQTAIDYLSDPLHNK